MKLTGDLLACWHSAVEVYKTVGPVYTRTIIEPSVRATLRDLTARYEAKALYTRQRETVSVVVAMPLPPSRLLTLQRARADAYQMADEMAKALRSRLGKRGILVEDTPLKRITLPNTLSHAIQSKLEMEQEVRAW